MVHTINRPVLYAHTFAVLHRGNGDALQLFILTIDVELLEGCTDVVMADGLRAKPSVLKEVLTCLGKRLCQLFQLWSSI